MPVDFAKLLGPYTGGTNLVEQARNARKGIRLLDGLDLDDQRDVDMVNDYKSMLESQAANSVAQAGLTAFGAIPQIISGYNSLSGIADTSYQQGAIDNISNIGEGNYSSISQLANAYSQLGYQPDINYEDIRGMSTGQKLGTVASSALAGAQAGTAIGGPLGAAVGGAVGLLSGIGGWIKGDNDAKIEQERLSNAARTATDTARLNLSSAAERISDNTFRTKLSNVASDGGGVRRFSTMKEFAREIENKPRMSHPKSSNITRTAVDGGVRIRIKIK